MLYKRPQMFLKSNGGASGASRQKGGGASKVYEGYKDDYRGDYSNFGYGEVRKLPVGAEFSVLHANTGKTSRFRLVEDLEGKKYFAELIKTKNGIEYQIPRINGRYYQVNPNMNSNFVVALLGNDAKKITILNDGKAITTKTRAASDKAFTDALKAQKIENDYWRRRAARIEREEKRQRQLEREQREREYEQERLQFERQRELTRTERVLNNSRLTGAALQEALRRQRERSLAYSRQLQRELREEEQARNELAEIQSRITRDDSRQRRFNF